MRIALSADDVPTKTGETVDFDESIDISTASYGGDIIETIEVYVDHLKHRLLELAGGIHRK